MKKITSAIVLICFLCNTAVSDLAFSQPMDYRVKNADKLAAASRFDNLTGAEIFDMSRIRLILERHLIVAAGEDQKVPITLPGLIKVINKYSDSNKQSPVRFTKVDSPSSVLCLRCRIKPREGNVGIKTYYAVFPSTASDGGFPIEVCTSEKWNSEEIQGLVRAGNMPNRAIYKTEDIAAIERGVAHQAFDREVLQWAHSEESGVECYNARVGYIKLINDVLFALRNRTGKDVETPLGMIPLGDRIFSIITGVFQRV